MPSVDSLMESSRSSLSHHFWIFALISGPKWHQSSFDFKHLRGNFFQRSLQGLNCQATSDMRDKCTRQLKSQWQPKVWYASKEIWGNKTQMSSTNSMLYNIGPKSRATRSTTKSILSNSTAPRAVNHAGSQKFLASLDGQGAIGAFTSKEPHQKNGSKP